MNDPTANESAPPPEVIDPGSEPAAASERTQSTTVGTGSYVAVSCTAMALLVTFVILGILFLSRWL